MDETPAQSQEVQTRRAFWLRVLAVVLLIGLAVGLYFLRDTSLGTMFRDRAEIRKWVRHHGVIAPLLLIGSYVMLTLLLAPVWELQIAAGYGFGLVRGVLWCEVAAVIGAGVATVLSRWLIGETLRHRHGKRLDQLHAFNEKLGHNGLLAVMGVRLCHFIPFSLSNYLFGLTTISVMDVLLGTLLGNLPAIAMYVALGANPRLVQRWQFYGSLAALNIVLLIPLALRYMKPQWFKRIGVE